MTGYALTGVPDGLLAELLDAHVGRILDLAYYRWTGSGERRPGPPRVAAAWGPADLRWQVLLDALRTYHWDDGIALIAEAVAASPGFDLAWTAGHPAFVPFVLKP